MSDPAPTETSVTNRRALLLGTSATMAGFAGCTTFMSIFGDLPLEDIIVVNAIDGRGSGSIDVLDPDGERILDERFDPDGGAVLPPDGDVSADQTSQYEDVLTTPGTHTITVELDEESDIDGAPALEAEIDIASPDDEHLLVAIGSDETAGPIAVSVIENLEDITDWNSCAAGC